MEDGVRAEILRLRDRAHDLANSLAAAHFQLSTLADWRRDIDAWKRDVEEQIDKMVKADEIADAVAARIRGDHQFRLTVTQKITGGLVVAVTVAGGVKALIFG